MLDALSPATASSGSARRDSSDGTAVAAETQGAAGAAASGSSFYRYRDPSGRWVIVDSLARVPSSVRGSVETVVLAPTPGTGLLALPTRLAQDFHAPSFFVGALLTLVLGALWLLLRRSQSRLLRLALLGGLMLVGSSMYLGWVRRTTGQGDSLVASPAALVEDARAAVQKMNERSRQQQRELEQLQHER